MENIGKDTLSNYYCVILAGGRGKRLWPLSREEKPKQFVDFFGTGQTLLQQTYNRILRILPKENIFVTTFEDYRDLLKEQLPDLNPDQMLVEPIRRGTAPIVAWATHRIAMRNPDAAFVVTPADQIITNEEDFMTDLLNSFHHVAEHHCLLTMGIRPTRPEPGYGYIQMGDPTGNGVYEVQSFTEKPEREFAEVFMNSGEFLWNTGLYLTTVEYAVTTFSRLLPSVMRSFDEESYDLCYNLWKEEDVWVKRNYTKYPNMSMEQGILEHADRVCVMECHFGWADIGGWHGVFEAMASTPSDNVLIATDAITDNAHGNIVRLEHGKKLVMHGLDNFVIVEHDDVLLIVPRSDSSDKVKRMLARYEGL